MSSLLLPTFTDPTYDYTLTLEGSLYYFRFRYNERTDTWALSLSDAEGNPLVTGAIVVCGVDLLSECTVDGRPPGVLLAVSAGGDLTSPGLLELGEGRRVQLFYVESTDL